MQSERFWELIDAARKNVDLDEMCARRNFQSWENSIFDEIVKLPKQEILSFELHRMNIWLVDANSAKVVAAQRIITGEEWLEFKGALGSFLVALGKDKFYYYVSDPDLLLDSFSLESIRNAIYFGSCCLAVATVRAWEHVTGLNEDQFLRLEETGVTYECESAAIKGTQLIDCKSLEMPVNYLPACGACLGLDRARIGENCGK